MNARVGWTAVSRAAGCAMVVGAALAATGTEARAQLVADSAAGFSSVQGGNNWWYGFYDGDAPTPFTPADFEPFPNFDTSFPPGVWIRTLGAGGYWTAINRTAAQPNANPSVGGRISEENWAVRRWISPATMPVRIFGHIADVGAAGGNGVIAKIIVHDVVRYEKMLADGDTTGTDFSIDACITAGDVIDFALTPNGPSDFSDGTIFTATVQGPITGQPQDVAVCDGGSASFTVETGGVGPFHYQWYKDDTLIPGATSAAYTVAAARMADEGLYACEVSVFACGHVSSAAGRLTICRADLTCDGLVDFSDYLVFLTDFDAGDPRADMNGDGLVDFSDYLDFVNMYTEGC